MYRGRSRYGQRGIDSENYLKNYEGWNVPCSQIGRTVTRLEQAVFEVATLILVNLESEFFAFVKILTLKGISPIGKIPPRL